MRLLHPFILFLTTSTALSPSAAAKQEIAPLVARQDATTSFDLSFSATQGNTATTISSAKASGTGKGKGSGAGKGGSDSNSTSAQTTRTFDDRLPAGGVQMITPSALAASQYYKIKDFVTFAWNYTSLSITPSAVDILASCSLNQATYTIALNQSITGPTQAVTWDTAASQTIALLTETYTLIIHDANKAISATAQAGYLATFEQFTFGMYVPQPYTPIADWVCATCSGTSSNMERQAMGFMLGMVTLTVLSFGWFSGLAGLW